jgi:hypothetical protein
MEMTYESIMGETPQYNESGKLSDAAEFAREQKRIDDWITKKQVAKQKQVSVRDYAKEGVQYQESVRKTSALLRSTVNLSITMRMFNPALYVSALLEVPFRQGLENATDLLMGTYSGAGGERLSAVGEKLGIAPKFTADEVHKLRKLYDALGESTALLGELMGEMAYQSVLGGDDGSGTKRSKADRFLEASATKVSRAFSDPTWGMRNPSTARRYVEGALEYLMKTNSQITVDQLVQKLEQDPLWLKKAASNSDFFNAHQAGVNRVAQVRSIRPTLASTIIMAPIDKMTGSSSRVANWSGHLLKIPFLFTRFNMNTFMTLTGLNALDQVLAMSLDGRHKPELWKRISSVSKREEYDIRSAERMNLSAVLEGVDLSRAFAKTAVTQTGLFMAGMMAGGVLNLDGEDDELKRRRKLAAMLDVPYLADPAKAMFDFRWQDAIFLDSIPFLDTYYETDTGHSAVIPHWMLKQFLSPVMGMARFMRTGNFNEVVAGYMDAASAIPNSVMNIWRDAFETSAILQREAEETSRVPEKEAQTTQLLVNAVGVLEKALIENSFVNALRAAGDTFDRDPWMFPRTAEENTGELDRLQGTDNTQRSDALQTVVEGEGEDAMVGQEYKKRAGMEGQLHQYAENNAVAAFFLSLFPGQPTNSSYARQNMGIRQRIMHMEEPTKAEAEALVLAAFEGRGGQEPLTKLDIINQLKFRDQLAGVEIDQAKIEEQAEAMYAAQAGKEYDLSILDKDAMEVIGKDGAKSVLMGLYKGQIQLGSAALQDISISNEMRAEIQKEWQEELIQEGVDLGLSDEAAYYRMLRIWGGGNTGNGLGDALWDDRIPTDSKAVYDQLNVSYVIGPDGKPWATPFDRMSILQALGVPVPHKMAPTAEGTTLDERGNVVDLVRGVNTGMAAVVPSQVEPKKFEPPPNLQKGEYTPSRTPFNRKPWKNFPRRGGYGGGGGYSSGPFFQRMNPFMSVYAHRNPDIQMVNTTEPHIRRADVRRERVTSERGRLKQWQ